MSTLVLPMISFPPPSWRSALRCLVLCGLLWPVGYVQAVELEQLWLPKSYLRHLPRLYDAARLVEAYPRCAQLLEGTSHLDRSTLEHPVFRFTCRNSEGESFSLLVDGPSLEKLDETRPSGRVSFEQLHEEYREEQARERERELKQQELAQLRLASEEAERVRKEWVEWWEEEYQRRETVWAKCVARLQERVGEMQSLEWLTDTMPEPELAQEPELGSRPALTFVIDFNAQSYYGEDLYYRAYCRESEDDTLELDIKARR